MQKKSIYLNIHNIIYILLDKNLTKINLIEKYNNTSIDLYMKLYN